ncbi:unnamed protein product [Allacma fusca]|uniref:Major facilitator superfamily (MFS) profile domain-containing protein n=1 Tax=Allacma fusca TaxID=39272 RepID=A0A8J2NK52_9HEXA|nr:unnamed protein product [Allacma fusca]
MTRTWILIVSGLVLGGGAFYLLGPLPIFGLDNTVWSNIIALVGITIGVSLANIPATEACLLSTIEAGHPDETATYAMVCSLISTGYSSGSVIGAFAAGFLVEGIGYPLTSAVFGSIMLAYGLIILMYFLIFHKPNKRLRARERHLASHNSVDCYLPGYRHDLFCWCKDFCYLQLKLVISMNFATYAKVFNLISTCFEFGTDTGNFPPGF